VTEIERKDLEISDKYSEAFNTQFYQIVQLLCDYPKVKIPILKTILKLKMISFHLVSV